VADLIDRDRRGQILLVTGLALAVAFVGLALVFNSVIYTENLATRSESTTTSDPISHARTMETGTERIVEYVNEYNASGADTYDPLRENLTRAFENVSTLSMRQQLNDGQVVNDSLSRVGKGTWIGQTNGSRNFTNVDGDVEWTLVDDTSEDVRGVRSVRFNVTDGSDIADYDDDPFNVTVEGSSGTWEMNVSEDSDYVVGINTSTDDEVRCDAGGSVPFRINVTAGTVAGNACPELRFDEQLSSVESIEFDNTESVQGRYRFVVNKSYGNVDGANYGDDESKYPFYRPAVYGVNVTVDYQSRVLTYRTDRRVVPGERDD